MRPEHYLQLLFSQLRSLLHQLTDESYRRPVSTLSGATIGSHIRHTVELYIELLNGYDGGVVNYGLRKRDERIEQDPRFAMEVINLIENQIDRPDKELKLVVETEQAAGFTPVVSTSFFRELIYTNEHTVHHMALIRAGLFEVGELVLDETFGLAYSTIKHKAAVCAR